MCVLVLGSCNEKSSLFNFSESKPDLETLPKTALLTYAHQLQNAFVNDPEVLNQVGAEDIRVALSTPDLERADGKGRVWQYRTKECVLDIYWTADKKSQIHHYELRLRQTLAPQKEVSNIMPQSWECLQDLVQERQARVERDLSERYAGL